MILKKFGILDKRDFNLKREIVVFKFFSHPFIPKILTEQHSEYPIASSLPTMGT